MPRGPGSPAYTAQIGSGSGDRVVEMPYGDRPDYIPVYCNICRATLFTDACRSLLLCPSHSGVCCRCNRRVPKLMAGQRCAECTAEIAARARRNEAADRKRIRNIKQRAARNRIKAEGKE